MDNISGSTHWYIIYDNRQNISTKANLISYIMVK